MQIILLKLNSVSKNISFFLERILNSSPSQVLIEVFQALADCSGLGYESMVYLSAKPVVIFKTLAS